jgi:N-acyl homoserine lactone hydrolase
MEDLRLIPLRVGELEVFKATQTYYADFDKKIWTSIYIWFIKGASRNIIVDTGDVAPNKEGMVVSSTGPTRSKGGGANSVRLALQSIGLTPDSIDTVILTHLHRDHVGSVSLFKKSKIIVQKSELEFARNPLPTQRTTYVEELVAAVGESPHLEVVEGDQKICEGLETVTVPGHTPGLQAISVQTKRGRVIMSSDSGPLYHNWFPSESKYGTPLKHLKRIPPGILYDLRQALDSMEKISKKADIIVPGHDPYVLSDFLYWA